MTIRQIIKELNKLTSIFIDFNEKYKQYYIKINTIIHDTFVSYGLDLHDKKYEIALSLGCVIIYKNMDKDDVIYTLEKYKESVYYKINKNT